MDKPLKIVLINPPSDCVDDDRVEPPLGLLYIGATAIQEGLNNIILYDMSGCATNTEISEKINNIPDAMVYGVSSLCTNYKYAKACISHIRANRENAYILMGGPNASAIPAFTYNDSGANIVITGEGEDAFVHAVRGILAGNVTSGVFNGIGRHDVDSYAFPARDLVDYSTYSRRLTGQPVISLLSSRGCVHQCIHCNSVVMGGGSNAVRYRSPSNILGEMEMLRPTYRHFRFNDDHFTGNPNLSDLLTRIKDIDIVFRIFARIEDLNQETCKTLSQAGCVHVSVGLESLDPRNLSVIGKKNQIGKETNIKVAKDNGLYVRASFIVGLPFDSDESIERRFSDVAKLGLDEFAVYPLIPYPGTMLAKYPERLGYTITNPDFSEYVQIGRNRCTCFALKHKYFDADDVRRWIQTVEDILQSGGVRHISKTEVAT